MLATLGWTGVLVLGLAYGALLSVQGDFGCEVEPGSSEFGEFSWSVLPPGPQCTFDDGPNGSTRVSGPGPVMSVWLALLVVTAWPCLVRIWRPRVGDALQRGRTRDRTILALLATLGWTGIAFLGTGYGVFLQAMGDAGCPTHLGSSEYGDFSWSLVPPGPRCTFDEAEHGFSETRGPGPVMSVWLIGLAATAWPCLVPLWRPRADEEPTFARPLESAGRRVVEDGG